MATFEKRKLMRKVSLASGRPASGRTGFLSVVLLGLVGFVLLTVLVYREKATQPAARVVVLGVDGLDLRLLDRLVSQGVLPNFSRLYREGCVGPVSTVGSGLPPISPRVWTSFATGQVPALHGLRGFVYEDEAKTRHLFSSADRKVPAVWEIVSAAGKSVGVVNWWFTYPAEPINGFVVSDRFMANWAARSAKFYGGKLERETQKLVYPPDLYDKLASVARDTVGAGNPQAAEAVDRNILALAFAALETKPVDLLMIYTRALDELSHVRWDTHERQEGEGPVADQIDDYMRRYDHMLAEVLQRLGAADSLVILSDHGFERNATGKSPPGVHVSRESAVGTLILYGPRFQRGARIEGADLLDVLPTILEVAGVPAAQNMPGKVLLQAMRPEGKRELVRVAAYHRSAAAPEVKHGGTTAADEATIERLRALGYLD